MTADANSKIRQEYEVIARRYGVIGASNSIWERYQAWRKDESPKASTLDRALLAATRLSRFTANLASVYAGRFSRKSQLRRCEVALLAFLECDPVSASQIDESRSGGIMGAWLRFFAWGFLEVLTLVLSLFFFAPIHLLGRRS